MKNFLKRLKYYGIGFGLGLVFVIFFFDNRGCSWLPGSRIKNTILGRVLVVSEKDQKAYDKLNLTDKDIVEFLNDGDINIGSSNTHGNPKVYEITKEIRGKEIKLWFTLPNETFISEVVIPKGSIEEVRNSKVGLGKMIHFPLVESIVFVKDDVVYLYGERDPKVEAQRKELAEKHKEVKGLQTLKQLKSVLYDSKQVEKYLKKNGKINFETSRLTDKPYPIQKIMFTTPTNEVVHASSYWLEDHITIESFDSVDTLDITKH